MPIFQKGNDSSDNTSFIWQKELSHTHPGHQSSWNMRKE